MDNCPCPDYARERRSVLASAPRMNHDGDYVYVRTCYWCGQRMPDHPVLEEGVARKWRGNSYLGGLAYAHKLADEQERLENKRLTHR